MSSTTAAQTILTLRRLFARYGLPSQVVSDNGPQFVSEEFAHFLSSNSIKHSRCSPYHPSSNGEAERFVRTFKQAMKASRLDGKSLAHSLENFLLTYRSTPHATTNRSPASLFLGRNIRTRFDLLKPDLRRQVSDKQAVHWTRMTNTQSTEPLSWPRISWPAIFVQVRCGCRDRLSSSWHHSRF